MTEQILHGINTLFLRLFSCNHKIKFAVQRLENHYYWLFVFLFFFYIATICVIYIKFWQVDRVEVRYVTLLSDSPSLVSDYFNQLAVGLVQESQKSWLQWNSIKLLQKKQQIEHANIITFISVWCVSGAKTYLVSQFWFVEIQIWPTAQSKVKIDPHLIKKQLQLYLTVKKVTYLFDREQSRPSLF